MIIMIIMIGIVMITFIVGMLLLQEICFRGLSCRSSISFLTYPKLLNMIRTTCCC